MLNKTISDNTKTIMVKIGKAIEKGVGEDIRTYLANSDNAVNNAIAFLRGDYIVTNIRNTVESETVEIKYFKRSSWTGCIILDRKDKHSYSVCARKTLERIPKNITRRSPHYLQTILNTENRDEEAVGRQMSLADFGFSVGNQFTEEEYEKDFFAIMENISYQVAAGKIGKDLLRRIMQAIMDGTYESDEELKLAIYHAIS